MNPVPQAITARHSLGQLQLTWHDGRQQRLDFTDLRRQCPCSQCRALRLRGARPLVAANLRLLQANPQGFGLQLVFSDGHERGIYPWAYLAQMSADTAALP